MVTLRAWIYLCRTKDPVLVESAGDSAALKELIFHPFVDNDVHVIEIGI